MLQSKDLISSFITYLKRQGKSESTCVAYKKDIEQLAQTNTKKPISDYSSEDIKKGLQFLKKSKDLSAKTLSRKLNSIRTFYKYLVNTKKTKTNPALNVEHPRYIPKKKRVLKPTEYLALKEASRPNTRLYTMIELLLQTGIRISELSRANIADVNMSSEPTLHIPANRSIEARRIPLNDKVFFVLQTYLNSHPQKNKPEAPLFPTRTGKHIEVRNIRSSIDRAILKARLKNTCVNDLRNTFIVHQLANGMSISYCAEIVGHKNEVTTQKYITLIGKKYKASGKDVVVEL